jgi:hypothetical protein
MAATIDAVRESAMKQEPAWPADVEAPALPARADVAMIGSG